MAGKQQKYTRVGEFMVSQQALREVPPAQLAFHIGIDVAVVEAAREKLLGKGPRVPDGYGVWYEHGVTDLAPDGRLLDGHKRRRRGVRYRRCTVAHVYKIVPAADVDEKPVRVEVATGVAVCNPKDQYVKAIGRVKSLGRALAEVDEDD